MILLVMSSIVGSVNRKGVPRYISGVTPALIEWSGGKLRSIMTLLWLESAFSLVINGEMCRFLSGGFLKGPKMAPKPFSSCKYILISSLKSVPDLWLHSLLMRDTFSSKSRGKP